MVGLINLFIFILRFPTLASSQRDVSLLDVAAGFFGHLEFVTSSELAFPFTRDVARIARNMVKNTKIKVGESTPPVGGNVRDMTDQDANMWIDSRQSPFYLGVSLPSAATIAAIPEISLDIFTGI